MKRHQDRKSVKGTIIFMLMLLNTAVLKTAFVSNGKWYVLLWLTLPLLVAALIYYNRRQNEIEPSVNKKKMASAGQQPIALHCNPSAHRSVLSSKN